MRLLRARRGLCVRFAETRKRVADLQVQTEQPFEYQERLASLSQRQDQLEPALDLTKSQADGRHFDLDQRAFPLKAFDVNEDQPASLDVRKVRPESAVVGKLQRDVLDPDAGLAKRAEVFEERPFGLVEFCFVGSFAVVKLCLR